MKTRYKFVFYVILFECIILLVFNLNSNKTLKFFTKESSNYHNNNNNKSTNFDLKETSNQNYKCDPITIEVNNPIALKHYRDNTNRYMPEFNKCFQKESAAHLIKISRGNSLDEEAYLIQIDFDKLAFRYELASNASTSVNCHAELFDKSVNIKERNWNLKTIRNFTFDANLNLAVNSNGFYHIYCALDKEVFFEDVRLVLPTNMSLLKEKTKPYFLKLKRMKENSARLDSSSNPMLDDLELITDEKCYSKAKSVNETRMNVLMLGIDSLSFPHLKRSFPRFHEFITKDLANNVVFENFNKIGENTYPNLLALFAGAKIEPFYEQDINKTDIDFFAKLDSTNHDLIPFIWKSYHDLNYLSMYNEEWPFYGCFNYLKNGFRFYPAHYYSHPFWFKYDAACERHNASKLCLNNEPTYTKSLAKIKYLIEQMNEKNKNTPYFSFNFLKYYTHDYLVTPAGFDAELTDLVRKFEQKGYLDNTLLILFSDHGSRLTHYGFYTEPGRVERSMPFLTIRLPKQLENTEFEFNLKQNCDKLVSMFDLYKTLRHFYYLNKYDRDTLIRNKECRYNFTFSEATVRSMRGVSLFERVDPLRTCVDALVPNSYCLCSSKEAMNELTYFNETNHTFNETGELLVTFVNSLTNEYRSRCALFRLDHIKSVLKTSYTSSILLYSVQFVLQPGDSVFEANLRLNNRKLEVYENKVNRLSKYRNQSRCIATSTTRHLLGFCYCK